MDLVEKLRPKRKEIVLAAEKMAARMFESDQEHDVKKAQLNHLIGVCGEATCSEEIENYVRYQAARKGTGWTPALAKDVIAGISVALGQIVEDRERVEAWRLYTIYLTRAFTYQAETKRSRQPSGGTEARPTERQPQGQRGRGR